MRREFITFSVAIISSVVAGITLDSRGNQTFGSDIIHYSSFDTISDDSKAKGSYENIIGNSNPTEEYKMFLFEPTRKIPRLRGFSPEPRYAVDTLNTWDTVHSSHKKDSSDKIPFETIPAQEINTELLNHKVPVCRSSIFKSQVALVEGQLSSLLSRLKKFISETTFDFSAFEKRGFLLEGRLQTIYQSLNGLAPCNTDLLVMHAFAKYLLNSMISAIEKLRYYSTVDEPSHDLLYSVVNINILLLSFYDIRGDPDTSTPNYAEKISSYNDYLNDWSEEFKAMRNVPFGKQVVFRSELEIAQTVLQPLLKGKAG